MSQSKVRHRIPSFDVVEFFEGATTERGEKLYRNMRVTFKPFGYPEEIKRVICCDKGIGITEEWIEETIAGLSEALEKDFPQDVFEIVRHKPNDIEFRYSGAKGVVN